MNHKVFLSFCFCGRKRRKGFSLIELLAVISIMVAMASILGLSMKPNVSLQFRGQVDTLVGTLENARQLAVSKNTYVWVAFRNCTDSVPPAVETISVVSTDGTDPVGWSAVVDMTGNSVQVSSQDEPTPRTAPLLLAAKPLRLAQTRLAEIQALDSLPTTLPVDDIKPSDLLDVQQSAQPTLFKTSTGGSNKTYSYVVKFSPSGQITAQEDKVKYVEIGLLPAQENSNLTALLRLNGLTGRTEKFQ